MSHQQQIHAIDIPLFSKDKKKFTKIINDFHDMCKKEFSAEELEDAEEWIESLSPEGDVAARQKTPPEFYPVYVMVTKKKEGNNDSKEEEEEVLGGIVLECYPRQKVFLLAYVVVSSKCRGQGVGRILVEYCKNWAQKSFEKDGCFAVYGEKKEDSSSSSSKWNPVILIEVFQTSNLQNGTEHADFAATANRQKVWMKLGFEPLQNVSLVHPGKLRGGKYNIAVQACSSSSSSSSDEEKKVVIAADQLTSWLRLFFRLIIECEDIDKKSEEDEEEEQQDEKEQDEALKKRNRNRDANSDDDEEDEEAEEKEAEDRDQDTQKLADTHLAEVGLDKLKDPLACSNTFWC